MLAALECDAAKLEAMRSVPQRVENFRAAPAYAGRDGLRAIGIRASRSWRDGGNACSKHGFLIFKGSSRGFAKIYNVLHRLQRVHEAKLRRTPHIESY